MELIILIILTCLLHFVMYYLRYVHFYRKPRDGGNIKIDETSFFAPVEGRIVYVNYLIVDDGQNVIINKQNRVLEGPVLENGNYVQIGIFMTPYNNHHLVKPIKNALVSISDMYTDLNSMMNTSDFIQPFGWWRNWINKKYNEYLKTNRRTIFTFNNDVQLVLIYDKYVDKLTLIDEGDSSYNEVLGFVHRGSQVDIIIPRRMVDHLFVSEGDKVKFDTLVMKLKSN